MYATKFHWSYDYNDYIGMHLASVLIAGGMVLWGSIAGNGGRLAPIAGRLLSIQHLLLVVPMMMSGI